MNAPRRKTLLLVVATAFIAWSGCASAQETRRHGPHNAITDGPGVGSVCAAGTACGFPSYAAARSPAVAAVRFGTNGFSCEPIASRSTSIRAAKHCGRGARQRSRQRGTPAQLTSEAR